MTLEVQEGEKVEQSTAGDHEGRPYYATNKAAHQARP